jgi:acyl carrier protein
MQFMYVVFYLEGKFNFTATDDEMDRMTTVREMANVALEHGVQA